MNDAPERPAETDNPFLRPHPILQLLREYPGLVVTAAYLLASVIGLMFSFAFYREFNVNVVNFYQLSDFLMAVLREPVTLLMGFGGFLVAWNMRAVQHWEWRKLSGHEPRFWLLRIYKRIARPSWANPWTDAFILLAYAWVFIVLYSDWKAETIRDGEGQVIKVQIDGEPRERVLLGASNTFLFLFDAAQDRVDVIPHESIDRVVVPSQPEE